MGLNYFPNRIRLAAALFCMGLAGCTVESTNYYADGQEDGLAIFSNKGNNLMTCYAGNQSWKTVPRSVTVVLSSTKQYELYIRKQNFNGLSDTLVFRWIGDASTNANNQGDISLSLIMPKGFGYKDFNALQGKRFVVDLTNGFFNTSISAVNPGNVQGTGFVYFHTAVLDSIAPSVYSGKMSGLIEADFNGVKLTKGRFDHTIQSDQVSF